MAKRPRCILAATQKNNFCTIYGTPGTIFPIFMWYPTVVPRLCFEFFPNRFRFWGVIAEKPFHNLQVIAIFVWAYKEPIFITWSQQNQCSFAKWWLCVANWTCEGNITCCLLLPTPSTFASSVTVLVTVSKIELFVVKPGISYRYLNKH